MNLSEFCIKRPVFATVLSLILVVIGIMGLSYLDTRFLPKFESNHLKIDTTYAGASAALVETSITVPIEEAVSGVEGIDDITSMSYQGYSEIRMEIKDGVDLEQTASKVRDKIQGAISKLPSTVKTPVVETGGNSNSDLMDISFIDPDMDLPAIRDYLERNVLNSLEQVPGVANVDVVGANSYIMRVELDPKKMQARRVTIEQVQQAIQGNNVELPAGRIRGSTFDYPLTVATKLSTAKEFNNIVVRVVDGNTVRIKDIGAATIATDSSTDSFVRVNNQPGILLSITPTDEANPIDTAKLINHYLERLKPNMPSGMKVITAYDQSVFMKNSIHEVYESILISIFCVLVIIYLFLGQLRSVSIPIVTIPICLLATFGIMYALGFSINIITLLALVLSIGLVVDDAIVMLENIHRYIEKGEKPFIAAIKGSKEITFAVIAMTLTLAAVYAPVGLIHGKVSAIFKPFALTLAGAVIVSGFVALTLSPMMSARLLKNDVKPSRYSIFLENFFANLANSYRKILDNLLNKKYLVVIIMVVIITGGFFLVKNIPFTFMPQEDIGLVIGQVTSPSGANIQYIAAQTEGVSKLLGEEPGVESLVTIASTSAQGSNLSFATLKPFNQRSESSQEIVGKVNKRIASTPGLNASAFPPSFGGSMHHQLEFSLMGDKSYNQLYQIGEDLIKNLQSYPGVKNLQNSLTFDSQQYKITVNRDLAAKLNVSVSDINTVVATMLGGLTVSTIDVEGQSYDVYLIGMSSYQNSLNDLNALYVTNSTGTFIPLSNFITVKPSLEQTQLPHYNRERSTTIDAQLGEGYDLGEVVHYLKNNLPNMLPEGVTFAFTGTAKDTADSSGSMGLIFILALVFIYLVLAAQFESFIDPLIILLSVPFSVIGALLALKLVGGTINIYTIVGLVTLIGLIAKHGILITQFANELKSELGARQALLKAASIRLRPILMTTAAMIFGALPLVFTSGASAESRRQIGVVIISGLFFGTFFSLVLVPVTYSFMDKLRLKFSKKVPREAGVELAKEQ